MKTINRKGAIETCAYCVGYSTMGIALITLGFGLTVAFCHLFGFDTAWACEIFQGK